MNGALNDEEAPTLNLDSLKGLLEREAPSVELMNHLMVLWLQQSRYTTLLRNAARGTAESLADHPRAKEEVLALYLAGLDVGNVAAQVHGVFRGALGAALLREGDPNSMPNS